MMKRGRGRFRPNVLVLVGFGYLTVASCSAAWHVGV